MKMAGNVLIFQVTNTASLESGSAAHFVFDKNGGTLGAGENNHWVIQDRKKNLPLDLARVEWRDNHYCLLVLGQASVLINNSNVTSKSGFIRLSQGDSLKLGEINLKVYLEDSTKLDLSTLSLKPEEIINNLDDPLKQLMGDQQHYQPSHQSTDPILNTQVSSDPLLALSDENNLLRQSQHTSLLDDEKAINASYQPHLAATHTDFMDLPYIKDQQSDYVENAYITISPLLREMNVQIPLQNSQDINDILAEIGKTLKATVDGLLALQKEQHSLSDKHLRPIEDNPLRLDLDYSATMDILFGQQKSPVHLAAPAAVSESLHNLLLHNEANRVAIVSALSAILQAFSPAVLLSRFENYRRTNEMRETNSAWAWEMYENYYRELTSTRQKGFEKLFWEVYAQAYDKALRENNAK